MSSLLKESIQQQRRPKMTTKMLLQWKTIVNHPLARNPMSACSPTFLNGAVAFIFTPNVIAIHQNNSGDIVNMNIKFILF